MGSWTNLPSMLLWNVPVMSHLISTQVIHVIKVHVHFNMKTIELMKGLVYSANVSNFERMDLYGYWFVLNNTLNVFRNEKWFSIGPPVSRKTWTHIQNSKTVTEKQMDLRLSPYKLPVKLTFMKWFEYINLKNI